MNFIDVTETAGGIPVITENIPGCGSAGFMVAVRTGSRDEDRKSLGISHLLEHVVFRRTESRTSYQMAKEMEGAGGMMNAFTGKEVTGFYGITLKETSAVAKEMVADIVAHPMLGDEDTELEKKIVLQELSMIKNDPESYIHDLFDETVWEGHELSQTPGGKERIVEKLTHEDLRAYYEDRYGRPNFAVFAAGAVNGKDTAAWASGSFDGMEAATAPVRKKPPVPKAKYRFFSNKSDHYQVAMGFPAYVKEDGNRAASELLSGLLGSGTSSRLFQEVREKNALVYSVYSALDESTDSAYLGIYMSSTAENVLPSVNAVSGVLRSLTKEGLEKGELERTKNLIKGSIIRSQESTVRRMNRLAREYMLTGKVRTLEDRIADIENATEEDVLAVAEKTIRAETLNTAVLGKADRTIKEADFSSVL
ncbi:MAG: M16 family metallopeptidase [Candidatus Methanomethylophilaceae archaeon]|jgi:predicted Zn-dependent peptidase